MPIVVDASVVAPWFLPDEASAAADALSERMADDGAVAPDLLWHEVRNLLVRAFRRGRLPEEEIWVSLRRFESLPLRSAGPGDATEVMRLAIKHGLTAYDAAYLALAKGQRLLLASFDKALRAAATVEGVALLPEALAS
jgi:predicted nucleic acid-binding protein